MHINFEDEKYSNCIIALKLNDLLVACQINNTSPGVASGGKLVPGSQKRCELLHLVLLPKIMTFVQKGMSTDGIKCFHRIFDVYNFSIHHSAIAKFCVSLYLDRDFNCLQDSTNLLPSNSFPNNEFSPLQVGVV